MIGNHQAGYDVSALGTTSIAGRGGIVTGCIIEDNVWDGAAVGNTPGQGHCVLGCGCLELRFCGVGGFYGGERGG